MKRLGTRLGLSSRDKDRGSSSSAWRDDKPAGGPESGSAAARTSLRGPQLPMISTSLLDTTTYCRGSGSNSSTDPRNVIDRRDPDNLKQRGSLEAAVMDYYLELDHIFNDPVDSNMSRPDRPRSRPLSLISMDAIAAELEEAKRSPGNADLFSSVPHSQQGPSLQKDGQNNKSAYTPTSDALQSYFDYGPKNGSHAHAQQHSSSQQGSTVPSASPIEKSIHNLSPLSSSASFYNSSNRTPTSPSSYDPMAAFFGTAKPPPSSVTLPASSKSVHTYNSLSSSQSSAGQSISSSMTTKPPATNRASLYNTAQPVRASLSNEPQTFPQAMAAEFVSPDRPSCLPSPPNDTSVSTDARVNHPASLASQQAPPLVSSSTSATSTTSTAPSLHSQRPLPTPPPQPHTESSVLSSKALRRREYTKSGNVKSSVLEPIFKQENSHVLVTPSASHTAEASHSSNSAAQNLRAHIGTTRGESSKFKRASDASQLIVVDPTTTSTEASRRSLPNRKSSLYAGPGSFQPSQYSAPRTLEKTALPEVQHASESSDGSCSSSRPPPSPWNSDDSRSSPSSSWTSDETHLREPAAHALAHKQIEKGKKPDKNFGRRKSEHPSGPFMVALRPLLFGMLPSLEWHDIQALRCVNRQFRFAIDAPEFLQALLQRFLGPYGYDSSAPNEVPLSLADLDSFLCSLTLDRSDYVMLAKQHLEQPLPKSTARMLQTAARAQSKFAARLRNQLSYANTSSLMPLARQFYKPGRALLANVWVPAEGIKSKDGWMSTEELIECERELQRAGVFQLLQRGDCVENICFEAFGNDGKLIFDGKFLRDLSYQFDPIGHAPEWINGLTFAPSHWHGVIASSTGDPIVYLDLTPFALQVSNSMTLHQDKVQLSSPQANYRVTRYVYRATIKLKAGTILGSKPGKGSGPAGLDCVHREYDGKLIIETEGTTEHAAALNRICTPRTKTTASTSGKSSDNAGNMHAFKVLRQRSRPGALCVKPMYGEPAS